MSTVTARIGRSKYETNIQTSNHAFLADEPLPAGKDLGPSPYELLLASLGSCVAMTLRMYADRKGWDLEEVEVQLEQSRVHANDCEDCESEEGYIHIIEKKLKFKGILSEKQKSRLLEIADRCPVHRTLQNEIVLRTRIE